MTLEELFRKSGSDYTSGDYVAKNFAEILPDSADVFNDLVKRSKEAKYDLFSSLQTLADKAAKLGLTVDVKETRPGNYEIRYLRSKELSMAEAELEKIKSTIPKFSISLDSHGIGDRYGMKSINQGVMDVKEGLLMAYTKNEQTIQDQLRRLDARGASSYAAKAVAGDDRMYKKLANSIRYTARKTQGGMSSAGSFYAQSDEAKKALQGTGSKQSLLARRGYFDMTPVIRELTADAKELHRQYVRQTKRFGADYLNVQEAIENDVMEMMAIAAQQLEYGNIMKEFQELRHGSKYEYILKNKKFQQLFFKGVNGQKGIAEQINSLHPYIGTSQEGSIGNKLMSFVKNSDLGILGGLDDPSSRKRVQVANILSYDKVQAKSKAARKKYTKEGIALTKAQKSVGIKTDDLDQRLYGELYASAEEIEAAQEAAVKQLLDDWIKGQRDSHRAGYEIPKAQVDKMRRKFEAEVGRYSGAHSGGVFYSKDIEGSLDATMQRYIRLSKDAIEDRENWLKANRKQFAAEEGKELSDAQRKKLRSAAVRDLVVKETGLGKGGQKRVLFDDIDDALADIGNGMYGLAYKQASHMKSGNKILTGNEYDRLTAAGINPLVLEKLVEARIKNGSLKYAGGAKDYIEKNAIAFVKQAEQLSARNISGQLEGYVNAVLDYARTNKHGNIFEGNSELEDWLSVQGNGAYVVNRDIFSVNKKGRTIGGADRKKAMFALIKAINESTDVPEWMKHAFDVVGGTVRRDPTKYIGLTTANQYHDYDYGAPGKTVQTDYRWAGAVRRSAGIAQMATGRDMSELRKLKTAYREGDERDRKNRETLKRLQADQRRATEATHRTASSDFSFKEEDLVLSYSPVEGRKAITYNEKGELVYADTGKPYKGEGGVYLDLNGPYHEIDAGDYDRETGGIYKEAFDASVYGALSKFHAARGKRKDVPLGDMYYAPGNKGFLRKDRDGRNVKGRYLALPGLNQEDWQFEDNPDVMIIPPQFASGIGGVMRADQEYRAIKDGLDPLNPDRRSLEEADEGLQNAMIAAMAGYYDDVNNKNGSFFKAGTKVRVQHSMMAKASSSAVKDLSHIGEGNVGNANDLDRLLNVSALANAEDLRDLLRNDEYDLNTEEGKAEYEDMVRNYLDYIYGDGTEDAIKAWKKGKKKTDVFGLEQFLLDSVTVGADAFERRLREAKGDISKMRGLGGEFARFPLSNGLDIKDVDVFAGGAGIAERGTLKVGLGLGRMVNADFDGDRLVLHMDMAEKAGLKKADKKRLNEQKQAAVDLQRDISLAVGLGELSDLIDEKGEVNTIDSDKLKEMFNDQAQQSGAIASRLNKAGTGLLSNNYQALTEMMDYLDQDLAKIDPSNIQAKKNAVQQMAIRNIFESFTQDAISSKKVSARLAKQYGENFDTDIGFLSDLKSLMDLFRAPETYQSRAGLDKAFQKAIDMGIFAAGEGKSPLANRIMAGTAATAQKLFTDKDGNVDLKSLMEIFGIKDEETMKKMLFDFSSSHKGIVKRGELGNEFYLSIDQLKDLMWDFEQKNPGKLAWQQRTRDYLPGHLSAKANVYKTIAGAELTKEEYDSLSPEIKELYEKYDSLAESAGKAKDAINAEADAEQAKIKIANQEGDAVGELTKKYEGLHEASKNLADALREHPNSAGRSVSSLLTEVFGDHFTTDVSGFEKAITDKLDKIRGKKREGTEEQQVKSTQRAIAKVAKDPAKALGYDDKATFDSFANAWVPTIVGRMADSLEQGLIAAAKADESWADLDYEGLVKLKKDIEKKKDEEGKNGGAFTDLYALLTDKEDGIFSLAGKYHDLLTMVFGKKEGGKIFSNAMLAGEGMKRNTLAMAGGDIRNVGQSEGNIIGLLAGRRLVHGRFDRLTSNSAEQEYLNDLTGKKVKEAIRNVTVSDKKYAAAMSDQYIAQQIAYVRSLEQIRDWGLSGEGGTDRTYEEFLNSDLASRVTDSRGNPLSKKDYYNLLGFDTAEGNDESKWKRISKEGASVTSMVSLMNKKTGKAETYNIGRTYRDKYTGKMKTIFGATEEQSDLIERLLAAGMSFKEWSPALQEAFRANARLNTDPEHNFEYAEVSEEEKKKQHAEDVTNALSGNLKIFRAALKARDQAQAELDRAVEEGESGEHIADLTASINKQTKDLNDTKEIILKNNKEYEKLHPLKKGQERTAAEKELLLSEEDLEREERISERKYVADPRKRRAQTRDIRLKREASGVYGQLGDAQYQLFVVEDKAARNKDPGKNDAYQRLVERYKDDVTMAQERVEQYEQGIEDSEASYKETQKKIAAEAKERMERDLGTKKDKYLTRGQNASAASRGNGFLGINDQIIRWVDRLMMGGAFQKFLQLVKTGMGQMVQKAKELDAAMTNLRIVTGDSASDAKNMMSQYSKLAKELGTTTTEVTNAATEWLRQGYETAEVTDLITASMYLSKLGMIDSTTATKDLTF